MFQVIISRFLLGALKTQQWEKSGGAGGTLNWLDQKRQTRSALIVGSGPAGLECAMQLARRGYQVVLSEAKKELGGRVLFESSLEGAFRLEKGC